MKLSLLLIPLLFFMTSCTIDWNDEKDATISRLEHEIPPLKAQVSKVSNDLSGALSAKNDLQTQNERLKYELDAITGDTYLNLKERINSDPTLDPSGLYKPEVFQGKNTGLCFITMNTNLTNYDEARKILENCKPGNIILEKSEYKNQNCILSPDGVGYAYPHDIPNSVKLGDYYTKTDSYVIFFAKREGEYCFQLIQTDPKSFQVKSSSGSEYGTDGKYFYSILGVFKTEVELQNAIKRNEEENNKRMEGIINESQGVN